MEELVAPAEEKNQGRFFDSLVRNNKKIREDRAVAISEDTQIMYKRKVEDLQTTVKRLKRDREGMLDLSPTSADSLVLASDFKSEDFIDKDMELGLKIRNTLIQLEIATERYNELFGGGVI